MQKKKKKKISWFLGMILCFYCYKLFWLIDTKSFIKKINEKEIATNKLMGYKALHDNDDGTLH